MADDNFIIDGFGALPNGIDSNTAPQLLPRETAAMATNATFRGQFITNRPNYRKINLSFQPPTSPAVNSWTVVLQKLFDQSATRNAGESLIENNVVSGFVTTAVQLSPTGLATNVQISAPFVGSINDVVVFFQPASDISIGGGKVSAIAGNTITLIPAAGVTFNSVNISVGDQASNTTIPQVFNNLGALQNSFNVPTNVGDNVTIQTLFNAASFVGDVVLVYTGVNQRTAGQYRILSSTPLPPVPVPAPEDLINALFQGCCYYKPLFGTESLMAAIGGHLFQFIIGPGTVSSATQVGTTFAPFVAPGIGQQVDVSVNSIYAFQIGQILYVLPGATPANQGDPNRFQIVSITGTSNLRTIRVSNLGAVTGTLYASGDFVSVFVTINDGSAFVVDRTIPGDPNSATNPVNWLWQSERWVINQDGQSLPIFFDGVASRRSIGNNQELPVGKMGAYVFGRNWIALPDGVSYMAGDIVGGSSGTATYNFKDAVLKAVENTYLAGGGTFSIPGNLGNITAMASAITLDAALGQGPIQVFTEFGAFSCNAPVDRLVWQDVTNPLQTTSLIGGGALGQDGVTSCNGDLIFRSANPTNGFRSLILGRRDFTSWGNTSQSTEVQRVLDEDNKALLPYVSEIQFDNRMLGTCFPTNGALGVYHQGLVSINFDPTSSLRGKAASIWDGLWTGLNIFKMVTGTFLGVQRAFAFVFNDATTKIELYELLPTNTVNNFDNGSIPIPWSFESAGLLRQQKGKDRFDWVEIQDGEIHLGKISSRATVTVHYKPEFSECWFLWTTFSVCSALGFPKGYGSPLGLGQPDSGSCDPNTQRPARISTSFQVRVAITGSATLYGFLIKSVIAPKPKFANQICGDGNCVENTPCIQFPLNSYSLNSGKHYSNDDMTIPVFCPDGSSQQIFVQAGTVNLTLPWAFGFTGPFPPLTLGCQAGGSITRQVPDGATQTEIDTIANEMIVQCATAIAQTQAVCPVIPPTFTTLIIQNYFDGFIANPDGTPSGQPAADGSLAFLNTPSGDWYSTPDGGTETIQGNNFCYFSTHFNGTLWQFIAQDDVGNALWRGETAPQTSPLGLYTRTGGSQATPASLTIVGSTTPVTETEVPFNCSGG